MRKIGDIAAQLEEVYNSGRTTDSDNKLEYEDFVELVLSAYGEIAVIEYYKQRQGANHDAYFAGSIEVVKLSIQKEKGSPAFVELNDYINLPHMAGIVGVYPYSEDAYRDPNDDYTRMKPGSDGLYTPKRIDDLGLRFFVPKGRKLVLYGGDEKGNLNVEYMPIGEETELPNGVAWTIIKEVYKLVMPTKTLPVDTTEDTNSNATTEKQKLNQDASI